MTRKKRMTKKKDNPVLIGRTGESGLGMTYTSFIIGKRGWHKDVSENQKSQTAEAEG
jgi:hypothetical protein